MKALSSIYSINIILCTICISVWLTCVQANDHPSNNYTVTDGNITCVVMATGIQLSIPYSAGQKNLTSHISIPSNATANGTCDNSMNTNTINIYFLNTYEITLVFKRTPKKSYHWTSVTISYQLDSINFPNATQPARSPVSLTTTFANNTNPVTSKGSYQCQGQTDMQLDAGVVMTIYDLHYRAFGNDSSVGFTKSNVEQCTKSAVSMVPDTDIAMAIGVGIALGALIVVVVLIYVVASRVHVYRHKTRSY